MHQFCTMYNPIYNVCGKKAKQESVKKSKTAFNYRRVKISEIKTPLRIGTFLFV